MTDTISQEAMAPPSDSITTTHKHQLPDVFKQDTRYYFRDNMPDYPEGKLTIWFQTVDSIAAQTALQLRAEKLAFEKNIGQIFL